MKKLAQIKFKINLFLFTMFHLNVDQSLEYQIMISFMFYHKMIREGIAPYGTYIGNNRIHLSIKDTNKITGIFKRILTKNNRNLLLNQNVAFFFYDMISLTQIRKITAVIMEDSSNEDEPIFIFIMKDEGYKYQYNGYQSSANRWQRLLVEISFIAFEWEVHSELANRNYFNNSPFGLFLSIIPFVLIFLLFMKLWRREWFWKSIVIILFLLAVWA